jgi:hypothetical protein
VALVLIAREIVTLPDWIVSTRKSWPPRSLNLSPNLFLLGYLKEMVYSNKPHTIEALKDIAWLEVVNTGRDVRRQ